MRGFAALHLRRFREHRARTTLSLAGIAVGSLIVVTMLGLFGSLTGSVRSLSKLSGGADIEVSGATSTGVDASLVDTIRSTPGVAEVAPIVRTPVAVDGVEALLVGADPSSPQLRPGISASCLSSVVPDLASSSIQVVIGSGLSRRIGVHTGGHVTVFSGARPVSAEVIGVVSCSQARVLDDGVFIATTLSGARTLSGRTGRVDSIFARSASGTGDVPGRLQAAIGDRAIVSSPQLRVRLAQRGLRPLQQGLLLSVSLAFVVAGFLVFNTMSMAALERRRELATLRAIGGRRRALLVGFLGEAAVLGLVGSVIGSIAGIAVARIAITEVPTIFLDFLGIRPTFILPPLAVPTGIAVGTIATVLAAALPARSAMRVPPVEAMRPEGVLEGGSDEGRTRPLVVGVGVALFVAGSAVTAVGTGTVVLGGFGAVTLGLIIATFGVTGRLAAAVARLASVLGSTGRLAAAGIERSPRRVWATLLAVTMAVGVVVSIGGVVRNQEQTFAAEFAPFADTSFWIQATGADTIPTVPRIPLRWAAEIAAVPGVRTVGRDAASFLTFGNEQLIIEGMDPATNVAFFRAAGDAGRGVLAGSGVIASQVWAKSHGLRVGSPVTVPTLIGAQTVRIAALVDVPVVVQGELGIDFNRYVRWFGPTAASGLEVIAAPGADHAAVQRAVERITSASPVRVHVYTGAEVLAGTRTSLDQSLALFKAMLWVVVAATALALLNTMAISVVERRRELGILRAVGTSRRTVRDMVLAEAAAITLGGLLIGTFLGLVQQWIGVQAMGGLVGFTVRYHFGFAPIITAAIAAVVMSVAGSIGPALRAGQVNVIQAIGYE